MGMASAVLTFLSSFSWSKASRLRLGNAGTALLRGGGRWSRVRWEEDGEGAAAPPSPPGSARDVPPALSFQDTICQHRPVGWEGEEGEERGSRGGGRG